MPTGSCLCGSVRYSFAADPVAKCLCHCLDCRKIGGSTYSVNLIIPSASFTLLPSDSSTSTLKSFFKPTEPGHRVEMCFCGNCGTTLYTLCEAMPGVHVVKAGTLDDVNGLEGARPLAELFVGRRVAWVPSVPGASQEEKMGFS